MFGNLQKVWKLPKSLENSKNFGEFLKFWKLPKSLENSKSFGKLQIFWNHFQIFIKPYYQFCKEKLDSYLHVH